MSCKATWLGLVKKKAPAIRPGAANFAIIRRLARKRLKRNTHTPKQKLETLFTGMQHEALTLMSG
jgi:hypothetical protein